jgi:hypothetical protein
MESMKEHLKNKTSHPKLALCYSRVSAAYTSAYIFKKHYNNADNDDNDDDCEETSDYLRKGVYYSEESIKIYDLFFKDIPNHPDLAAALKTAAIANGNNGNYQKQLEYSLRSSKIYETVYKDKPDYLKHDLAFCYSCVSEAYLYMYNRYYKNAECEEKRDYLLNGLHYSKKSIEILQLFFEEKLDHPYLIHALKFAAIAYGYDHEYEKQHSLKSLEYSLKLFEIVHKDKRGHPDVINACYLILSSVYNIVKMNMPNWKEQTWQALLKAIHNAHANFKFYKIK